MRSVVTNGRGEIWLEDGPVPMLQAGQVRVRSTLSLISPGTELHYARQKPVAEGSLRLGYCAAGTIIEVGSEAPGLKPGDEVVAMGWGYATHSEQFVVPVRLCVKTARKRPAEQTVFAGLLATALHAADRGRHASAEARVLIIGAGLVGQLLARGAKISARTVVVLDVLEQRLALAAADGIAAVNVGSPTLSAELAQLSGGLGFSHVYVCTSGARGFDRELVWQCLSRSPDSSTCGRVICVGRFPLSLEIGAELGNVDLVLAARCGTGYRDDAYVHGRTSYRAPEHESTVDANLERAVRLIENGQVDVSRLLERRVPFSLAPDAYRLFGAPNDALGVTLVHPSLPA